MLYLLLLLDRQKWWDTMSHPQNSLAITLITTARRIILGLLTILVLSPLPKSIQYRVIPIQEIMNPIEEMEMEYLHPPIDPERKLWPMGSSTIMVEMVTRSESRGTKSLSINLKLLTRSVLKDKNFNNFMQPPNLQSYTRMVLFSDSTTIVLVSNSSEKNHLNHQYLAAR